MVSKIQKGRGADIKLRGNSYSHLEEQKFKAP